MRKFVAILLIVPSLAFAQAGHRQGQEHAGRQSPSIKALTDQQIADLRAGHGMGLALAAERNGYPGPAHVLDLAVELLLTPAQLGQTRALHAAMRAEAMLLGESLVEREGILDRLFADGTVTTQRLEAATSAIGEVQGMLREVHLRYHVTMRGILSPDQIRRYVDLRGTASGAASVHRPGER